jgi:DNA-binding response OmpR family regulator
MEPQVAGAYELFLSARGYVVSAVSSVAAGLRSAAAAPPEIAILGNIPDNLDVSTVAQRLRAVVGPKPLMVLVLSANMDSIEGADIVIPRGAHPRALIDAVRTAARKRPVTQPLATSA